ncbi:MAG: hypothetical protein MUO76_14820 [Anaerolineaceae bacterium]|jgi:hypothetical protein|nr:hypothetical protein [Anaerolineaceae bacterium]
MSEQAQSNSTSSNGNEQSTGQQITPELVNEITEKVYAMLLRDLKIENERLRYPMHEHFFPRR